MGASIVLVQPLRPSNATLAPTPPSELRTPPQVAGRPGEAAWALDPAPAPGHGETAEGARGPHGRPPGPRTRLVSVRRKRLVCLRLPGPPSGRLAAQAGRERPIRSLLWWEGPEEVGLASVPGGGRDSCERRGRQKEKAEREAKSLEHPVFPRGLPSKF